jgi:hypothetical protein
MKKIRSLNCEPPGSIAEIGTMPEISSLNELGAGSPHL